MEFVAWIIILVAVTKGDLIYKALAYPATLVSLPLVLIFSGLAVRKRHAFQAGIVSLVATVMATVAWFFILKWCAGLAFGEEGAEKMALVILAVSLVVQAAGRILGGIRCKAGRKESLATGDYEAALAVDQVHAAIKGSYFGYPIGFVLCLILWV